MRDIILLVFLFSFVLCPYPGSTEEDFEPKRREINKKLSNQIKECILNQKITKLFREKIDANPDEDIVIIKYKIRNNLTKEDKGTFRKCTKEIGKKYLKSFGDKKFKNEYKKIFKKNLRLNNTK